MNLLEVRNLHLTFYDTEPPLEVVRDISFSMKEGGNSGACRGIRFR